ncbi:MAG: FHA domain-containing protein [bacterium]
MLKPGLEIVSKGEVVERVILNQRETRIGRRDDNDIVLSNVSVSRHHAKIVDEGGQFHVVDLGSANGVLIGGKKIAERAAIQLGDEIAVGKFVLRFVELDTSRADVRAGHSSDDAPAATGSTFEVGGAAARRLRDTMRQGGDAEDTRIKSEPSEESAGTLPPPTPLPAGEPRRVFRVYQSGELCFEKLLEHVPFSMGRASDNDLILNKAGVSRYHAVVQRAGSSFTIEDLGSRNGTFVNGEKVKSSALAVDDEVRIGDFRVVLTGAASAGAPSEVITAEPVKSSSPDTSFAIATEGRTLMSNGAALRAELKAASAAAAAAAERAAQADSTPSGGRAQFEFPVKDVAVSIQFLGWVTSFRFKPDSLNRAEGHDASRDLVTIRLDMGDRILSRTIPIASLDLESRSK